MKNKGLVITMIILLTIIVAILIVILCLGISGKISFMGFIRAKSKDIVYDEKVLRSILASEDRMAVAVDDGWYAYWAERSDNPLDDAETLKFDRDSYLTEIGLKTDDLADIQAQYIGLMRFRGKGLKAVLGLCEEAKQRSDRGERLWRTERTYEKMYMTDLLQGLIDEGNRLRAVHIDRGWFEVDNPEDLKVAEKYLT